MVLGEETNISNINGTYKSEKGLLIIPAKGIDKSHNYKGSSNFVG